jgi:protein-arginine kinase activator protein McsA
MPIRTDIEAERIQRRWDAKPTWPQKRNCAHCQRTFFCFTGWQRFCCPSCANAHGDRQA